MPSPLSTISIYPPINRYLENLSQNRSTFPLQFLNYFWIYFLFDIQKAKVFYFLLFQVISSLMIQSLMVYYMIRIQIDHLAT